MWHCKFRSQLTALLAVCFALTLFSSNALSQESKLIESLDVQGNRRFTDEEILRHIKTRPGERLDQERVQADLRSLSELGVFDPSSTRVLAHAGVRGGVHVIFEVREYPLTVEVRFDGLRTVTKDELLAELRLQNAEIVVGSPYRPEKVRKAHLIILNYLHKTRGFTGARVVITEEVPSAISIKLAFVIHETPEQDKDDHESR